MKACILVVVIQVKNGFLFFLALPMNLKAALIRSPSMVLEVSMSGPVAMVESLRTTATVMAMLPASLL